jgi:hypothetical protein
MICPVCEKLGKKSTVYPDGWRSQTLLYCQPFYDEAGEYHHHDRNTTTSGYRCSNGHQWKTEERGSCWCGWTGGETTIEIIKGEE